MDPTQGAPTLRISIQVLFSIQRSRTRGQSPKPTLQRLFFGLVRTRVTALQLLSCISLASNSEHKDVYGEGSMLSERWFQGVGLLASSTLDIVEYAASCHTVGYGERWLAARSLQRMYLWYVNHPPAQHLFEVGVLKHYCTE